MMWITALKPTYLITLHVIKYRSNNVILMILLFIGTATVKREKRREKERKKQEGREENVYNGKKVREVREDVQERRFREGNTRKSREKKDKEQERIKRGRQDVNQGKDRKKDSEYNIIQ